MRVLEQDRFEIVSLRMTNAAPVEGGGPSKALRNGTRSGGNTQLDFGHSRLADECSAWAQAGLSATHRFAAEFRFAIKFD